MNVQDIVLQKFQRFKETFVSSNIPNNVLLELIESYIKPNDADTTVESIPVLDGQLSLFDIMKEMVTL